MILLPRALPLAKGTVRVIFCEGDLLRGVSTQTMTQKGRMQRGASDVEIADGGQRRVAEGLQQIGGTHGKNSSNAEIYR